MSEVECGEKCSSAWAAFTTRKHLSAGLPIHDLETLTTVANSTHKGT